MQIDLMVFTWWDGIISFMMVIFLWIHNVFYQLFAMLYLSIHPYTYWVIALPTNFFNSCFSFLFIRLWNHLAYMYKEHMFICVNKALNSEIIHMMHFYFYLLTYLFVFIMIKSVTKCWLLYFCFCHFHVLCLFVLFTRWYQCSAI